MRGRIGPRPEIARRRDEAGPEMMRPDAVDDDAGGQRIRGIGNRPGELETSAAVREGFFRLA